MRDAQRRVAPRAAGRRSVGLGRLPLRRVRLVTALFTDLEAALDAATALEEHGYQRDRITVVLSPARRNGPDLEIRRPPRGAGARIRALREPGSIAGGPRPERLDDLLEDAYLIVAAEAVTDAEGTEVDQLLTDSGGRVVGGTNGMPERAAPTSAAPERAARPATLSEGG